MINYQEDFVYKLFNKRNLFRIFQWPEPCIVSYLCYRSELFIF